MFNEVGGVIRADSSEGVEHRRECPAIRGLALILITEFLGCGSASKPFI